MFTPSNLQNKAIHNICDWYNRSLISFAKNHFYLAGYAGSGKSTVLPFIIDNLGLDIRDVAFCAPTGKAAKVMTKKLRSIYPTVEPAKTIHSLIYMPGVAKADAIKLKLDTLTGKFETNMQVDSYAQTPEGIKAAAEIEMVKSELEAAYRDDDKPRFHLNLESAVKDKSLIVVDEASMVGEDIADDLAKFNVPILAIGDPGQLPPVGDLPGLTAGEPDFFLDEIHRQAKDNPIIWLSMKLRNGEMPKHDSYGDVVHIVKPRKDIWTLDMDYNAQVICGTHKKRWRLTDQIRKEMGLSATGPMKDEPLLVCKNSRNIADLVNGTLVWNLTDIGDLRDGLAKFAIDIEDEETGRTHKIQAVQSLFEEHVVKQRNAHSCRSEYMYKAKKECEHLDFGYVLTCHKSQGSQWDNVIVHDESGAFREDAFKWAYTAVTRASQELIWITP
jgi:exodeoxyribonuclease-5